MRETWEPTPVLLPGKFHGWRSLIGYSPWGCKESDMTEQLHFHFTFFRKGQWNALETTRVTKSSGKKLSQKRNWGEMEISREEKTTKCLCIKMPAKSTGIEWWHLCGFVCWSCPQVRLSFYPLTLLDLCIIPWCLTLHDPLGGDSTTSYLCVLGKFLSFL